MPDNSQIEITYDSDAYWQNRLSKYISEENMNYVSREHVTVFSDGEKYFVEDGKTMFRKSQVRIKHGFSLVTHKKEEITEKGKRELKDGDEINIADTVIFIVYFEIGVGGRR